MARGGALLGAGGGAGERGGTLEARPALPGQGAEEPGESGGGGGGGPDVGDLVEPAGAAQHPGRSGEDT